MQIVIKISEESYNKLMQKSMLMSASAIDEAVDAVKKGMVLPKGHGILIDVNDLLDRVELEDEDIDFIPTIIPADKDGD